MAILTGEKISSDKVKVESICYTMDVPVDESWYQVNSIPDYPEIDKTKKAEMFFIPSKKEFEFVITDREPEPMDEKDKRIEELEGMLKDATSLLIETGGL